MLKDVRHLARSLVALEMRRPISVKREHPAELMIPDVSTATEKIILDLILIYFKLLLFFNFNCYLEPICNKGI